MVAPVAGGVALVAVLDTAQLGIWAALAVSLAVAIAALMCLRARHWTQTIIRHLQNPPPGRSALAGSAPAHPPGPLTRRRYSPTVLPSARAA